MKYFFTIICVVFLVISATFIGAVQIRKRDFINRMEISAHHNPIIFYRDGNQVNHSERRQSHDFLIERAEDALHHKKDIFYIHGKMMVHRNEMNLNNQETRTFVQVILLPNPHGGRNGTQILQQDMTSIFPNETFQINEYREVKQLVHYDNQFVLYSGDPVVVKSTRVLYGSVPLYFVGAVVLGTLILAFVLDSHDRAENDKKKDKK